MKRHLMTLLVPLAIPAIAHAANVSVGVSASTPNAGVKVQVGNPPPAPVVVERETVIIKEKHDEGKHKGHYKKKKKHHKKHDD